MPSQNKTKPQASGWAAKFSFGGNAGRCDTSATPGSSRVAKPKPMAIAYNSRFDLQPPSHYCGKFSGIQQKIVIPKPKPLVIRVIHNPPQLTREEVEAQRNTRAPECIIPFRTLITPKSNGTLTASKPDDTLTASKSDDILTVPKPDDTDKVELAGWGVVTHPLVLASEESTQDQGISAPPTEDITSLSPRELFYMELENMGLGREQDRCWLNQLAERRTRLSIERRTSTLTDLHVSPRMGQPILLTNPPLTPRGLRTDYIKILWEKDLLRNPQRTPSVISVSTVDTCILDRPTSAAASFVSSETAAFESSLPTTHSRPVSIGNSINYEASIASVVTCIFNPQVAVAAPPSPFTSVTSVGGVSHEGGELVGVHVEDLHNLVLDGETDSRDGRLQPGAGNNLEFTVEDDGGWNSDTYSLFGENTPGCWAGEDESQATDSNFDQRIGIATTSPSGLLDSRPSSQVIDLAFTELESILGPVVNGERVNSLSGWPLQDNDNFEFTIEDGRSVSDTPLPGASTVTSDGESGPQALESAVLALGELINLTEHEVETDSLTKSTNPLPKKPRPPVLLKRWFHRLKGMGGTKGEEQQAAKPGRWNLLRDLKVKT